jgi:SpoVK/Ycf46/Vps4 family AAA+-type ATPase
VLFEPPGAAERDRIWRVQVHPRLTPLAGDVDFRRLADQYEATGGDIRNAVLKAAMAAALEPGDPAGRMIHHRHLDEGIRDVLAGKRVMQQSLFDAAGPSTPLAGLEHVRSALEVRSWALPVGIAALVTAMVALLVALLR